VLGVSLYTRWRPWLQEFVAEGFELEIWKEKTPSPSSRPTP